MIEINPARIAYALCIIGIMFCFVISRRQKKDIRNRCDAFAAAFVKLSNYICPNKLNKKKVALACRESKDGSIQVLPLNEQPQVIQDIIKRANSERSVKLFAQLTAAAEKVTREAGINRTRKYQYSDPINKMLEMTHTFLVGCENPATINSRDRKDKFDSFLYDQVHHRMELLKRISLDMETEFQDLNIMYANEMQAEEDKEREKRRRGGGKR